jgi:hypothetical protein
MDLVTLVTACALSVEPKLMHALIWHQSGGEPWAVAVRNEPMPRIYSSMQEAISEAHSVSVANDTVRVGLTGLPVSPLKANAAMFLPCRNVAIAAQRIAKLADRCKGHPRLKTDPNFCAVAVYRGSWQQPDVKFAQAVAATVAKGDAPNFDMPKDATIELLDIGSDTPPPSDDSLLGSISASEERDRGWSSALFPSNPQQSANEPNNAPSDRPAAEQSPSSRVSNARPSTTNAPIDHLFVPTSSVRICADIVRSQTAMTGDARRSQEFAGCRTNGQEAVWRRPTDRKRPGLARASGIRSASATSHHQNQSRP